MDASEVKALDKALTNDPTSLYKGVSIAGVNHTYLACEPGFSVVCCLKRAGFIIVKTSKCIIIVEYKDDAQSGHCYSVVQKLAEQLRIQDF